ncbi:MAG: NHLP family bacteriocin export ABC transporter peptidase/permease/ATPase subunit [Planctomycetota bacterium]|nr:MAG: NHLP family bacteriocin export ABC transporter peptidase/permease/ATPase subunit [Planctomycetota bacterium]
MEAVECGAVALGIVLAAHGRYVPLAELRDACGVSRDGSKASNILKAARRYGLEARGYKKSLESVREVPLPAILFWGFDHFVVLEGFRKDRAYINDPAQGRRTVSGDEFDEAFTGVVLVLRPGPDFRPGGRPPSVLGSLQRAFAGSGSALVFCILAGILSVVPALALPILSQVFVDEVLVEARTSWATPLLAGMLAATALASALDLLQLRHLRALRAKLATHLSSRFLEHVLRLPLPFFTHRYSGEVAGRIALNDRVAALLSGRLARTSIDAGLLFLYGGLMVWYDPILTLVGAGGALANAIALRLAARTRVDAHLRALHEEGKVEGLSIAGLQSMETIKASALEDDFFARWAGHYARAFNAGHSLALANEALGQFPRLVASLTSVAVLTVGGFRILDGALTIGMLIAFQALLAKFNGPLGGLTGMVGRLQTLRGDLLRLDDVLAEPQDPLLSAERGNATAPRLQGHLELRELRFGYSPLEQPLIDGLSLTLRPGERVALVGPSGSGKSTVARLAAGLLRPWSGEVLLDGQPIERIPRSVLACSLGFVEQEEHFFPGTLRENLVLWDPAADPERVERAIRDAALRDTLHALPGGLEAELLEGGANLSGGQRQRFELARALVREPSLLILDEATSALDAETEAEIDRRLRARGCGLLIVAHRLSTVRDCDEILVLEHGEVVERGTYDELLLAGGAFAALVAEQSPAGGNRGD